MSQRDQLLERLERLNPVPDLDRIDDDVIAATEALLIAEQRRNEVSDQLEMKKQAPEERGNRTTLKAGVAIAAGVAVVVGAMYLMNTSQTEEQPPATAPATTAPTTTSVSEEALAQQAVDAAFAAYVAGDAQTWATLRDRGSGTRESRDADVALLAEATEAIMAAGGTVEVRGCDHLGLGTWEDVADEGPVEGHRITCEVLWTDRLRSAAGLTLSENVTWVVADGDVVASISEEIGPIDEYREFFRQFNTWMFNNQPDVFSQINWVRQEGAIVGVAPDSVQLAEQWVEEFAAATGG